LIARESALQHRVALIQVPSPHSLGNQIEEKKENFKIMSELSPQPLPPRIELGEAVEVITSAILRAIDARKINIESPTLPLPPPRRIIAGGILELQGGLTTTIGEVAE